ncbi:YeiH family protein (plasmid) [Cereibacter azotoformans]|uniref:YeiH family protein n=1 Tax=Cereibacter azotoformans TaxID=43057 RepID=UPI003B222254
MTDHGMGSAQGGIRTAGRRVQESAPGLVLCCTIALAASFVSDHHGGPTLLYALLLGMAFFFLSKDARTARGVTFAGRHVLRIGVALLGARITVGEILDLGWPPIVVVLLGVTLTILAGVAISRALGLPAEFGILSGGATAICGASAAMALSAALPRDGTSGRDTLFVVIAVTTLSTVAMVVYPLLVRMIGMDETQAGIFLGATIHDVAQVVGAAFMLSDGTGQVATLTKLLRVAFLVPVVLVVSVLLFRGRGAGREARPPVPGFLVAFVLIVAANSLGLIPDAAQSVLSDVSRACLVVAIAGLGVQTSFQELAQVGWKPVAIVVAETIFLAMLVLGIMMVLG